jgi:hypothetical protein
MSAVTPKADIDHEHRKCPLCANSGLRLSQRLPLRAALTTSHRTMPNLVIKDDDADSIIAYILSLRDSQ